MPFCIQEYPYVKAALVSLVVNVGILLVHDEWSGPNTMAPNLVMICLGLGLGGLEVRKKRGQMTVHMCMW